MMRLRLDVALCVVLAGLAACAEDYGTSRLARGGSSGESPPEPPDASPDPHAANAEFPRSSTCATCHASIVQQWSASMHARASTSITTVIQTNLVAAKKSFGDGPRALFCVSCHAPVQATVATDALLPVKAAVAQGLDDGVSCGACHQFARTPTSGIGGVAADFSQALTRGPKFYGPIGDPFPSTAHASEPRATFGDEGALCGNCHNVSLDRDGDARIHVVKDLVLQSTSDEYDAYRQSDPKSKTCAQCHMPALAGITRAAEGVPDAPPRVVHDHGFVGVDRALDGSPDPQAPARKALLAGAATLEAQSTNGTLIVSVTNSGAGHALPSGFAFARQMWIELVARDAKGNVVFSSGAAADAKSDLCEPETLASPLAKHVRGCNGADPFLALFQQRLVDEIVASKSPIDNGELHDARGELVPRAKDDTNEVVLQTLAGGAVPRVRSHDNVTMSAIPPGATRTLRYELANEVGILNGTKLTVRLLFRALPPYFVRALMEGHPAQTTALDSLEIIEMATADVPLPL